MTISSFVATAKNVVGNKLADALRGDGELFRQRPANLRMEDYFILITLIFDAAFVGHYSAAMLEQMKFDFASARIRAITTSQAPLPAMTYRRNTLSPIRSYHGGRL